MAADDWLRGQDLHATYVRSLEGATGTYHQRKSAAWKQVWLRAKELVAMAQQELPLDAQDDPR